jgi:hypothetical protein
MFTFTLHSLHHEICSALDASQPNSHVTTTVCSVAQVLTSKKNHAFVTNAQIKALKTGL